MKIAGVILARLDSSRLPGKSLRPFAGRPLLDWLLDRLAQAKAAFNTLVLATTDRPVDDPLAEYAAARQIGCFRGSVDDVAGRSLAAAASAGATHFFRINGDSPFPVPTLLEEAATVARAEPDLDFITNLQPRTWPYGVSCELFRSATFKAALERMTEPRHREHVSLFFYEHLRDFRWRNLPRSGAPLDQVRLTVDTAEDAEQFERILKAAGSRWSEWTLDEIVSAITSHARPAAA